MSETSNESTSVTVNPEPVVEESPIVPETANVPEDDKAEPRNADVSHEATDDQVVGAE